MTDLNEKRQSLHLLKKVAQKHYTIISNALSVADIERAQRGLDDMMGDFDKAVVKLSRMKRKSDNGRGGEK